MTAAGSMDLNRRALVLVEDFAGRANDLRVAIHEPSPGAVVIDCGVHAPGGIEAGLGLARTCLADLASVSIVPGTIGDRVVPGVQVSTDHPVAACLASQYAGWAVQADDFFAMGSGPMRAARGAEELFEHIGSRESAETVVGALETRAIPGAKVVEEIAEKCGVEPRGVRLLVAPTASIAGGIQVVARSVETALHKLHQLEFDLERIVAGWGVAPLPPVASGDLEAIGRTNDAVLYGGRVTLWVRGDDASLENVGPRVPSNASKDHGVPFLDIFERYDRDFYKIDPSLFSPAEIVLQNVESGRTHRFGELGTDVLERSLFS